MIRTSRLLEWWWDSCQECQRSRQWDNHRSSRSADQLCQSSPPKGLPWSPLSLDCNQFSLRTFLISWLLASLRGRWRTSRWRGKRGGTVRTPKSLDRPRTDGTSFENKWYNPRLKAEVRLERFVWASPTMAYQNVHDRGYLYNIKSWSLLNEVWTCLRRFVNFANEVLSRFLKRRSEVLPTFVQEYFCFRLRKTFVLE